MRSSTGRWVSGDDFFDRDAEIRQLKTLIGDGNHVLLTGQRRMGKTSVLRELGRRLQTDGWTFLPLDIEGALSPEDVIADFAEALHPHPGLARRATASIRRWFGERFEEASAFGFRLKVRAALNPGNWPGHGDKLVQACAQDERPVLIAIDELPIFLTRILRQDGNAHRVDHFLSWLRRALQAAGDRSPVILVSGSIGLQPLVARLGLSDRINYLHAVRLGPWDRETSIACLQRLAETHDLALDQAVPNAVLEALGIGVPHHVQSFFARLRDYATMHDRDRVTLEDVETVYRSELLGPSGQTDLAHYETRLKDALDPDTYTIALEILAEAATQDAFTPAAERCLASLYSRLVPDARARITDALEVLLHDGYLTRAGDDLRFEFRLLHDYWSARFRGHHVPLGQRRAESASGDQAP